MRELLRALLKTGSGSAASLLLGMVTVKIMAVTLSTSGVGLFSLLRQTLQTALALAILNGQTALVQGIACREGNERREYLATVLMILSVSSGAVAAAFLCMPQYLAHWIVGKTDAGTVQMIRWLSVPVALSAVQSYFSGVLNGYRAIGRIALVQAANFGAMACLAFPFALLVKAGYPLSYTWLLGISSLISACTALYFVVHAGWMPGSFLRLYRLFSMPAAGHFLRMAGTMLVIGFVGAWIPLALRSMAARCFSLAGAGIFDVAWTVSMAYVTLILTSFSTYYLPTLTRTQDLCARIDLISRVLRISMIVLVPLIVTMVVFRPLIIRLLYSHDFLASSAIMRWMLIGDYFKVTSWVFSFTMIAFADMKTYLWTEVLWGGLLLGGAYIALNVAGSMQGIGIVLMVLYVFYFIYTFYYAARRHRVQIRRKIMMQWLAGLAVVCGASVHHWNMMSLHWAPAAIWLSLALYYGWRVLETTEQKLMLDAIAHGIRMFKISEKNSPF